MATMTTNDKRVFVAAIVAGKSDEEAMALVERLQAQRLARKAQRQAARRAKLQTFDLADLLWNQA